MTQVAANPATGQFAVSNGTISLADDPTGHTVEVSTRAHWIIGQSDDVTVQGFTMRHATTDAQDGAITNGGYPRWTIERNVMSDVHGPVVDLSRGVGHGLFDNDI